MIRYAIAHTRFYMGDPPEMGMVTFVDADKVKAKSNPGACFLAAGFRLVGETKAGLLAFQMLPDDMPPPEPAAGDLFATILQPTDLGR